MEYLAEVVGKGGIVARCVAKSTCESGVVITTMELEYPRFIHSELMTHRLFSRNSASSRAIPIEKVIEAVRNKPAMPVHWGKNKPGMQASEEITNPAHAEGLWRFAAYLAVDAAKGLHSAGLHKQVVNRILEPFTFMKVVVTSTEWNNWDHLREHSDADPTIAELARVTRECRESVGPVILEAGEYHTPYFRDGFWKSSGYCKVVGDDLVLIDRKITGFTLAEALAISSSCCAQVSFRSLDPSLEKAERIFDRLVNSKPVHASPFEHQATPIESILTGSEDKEGWKNIAAYVETWQEGVTHADRDGFLWSGNFKNWVQHRQLIDGHVVEG